MTFEDLWGQVAELKVLSSEALRLVPDVLSLKTKKRLCKKKPEEVAEIVQWAIKQIDHGSIETVDALVSQKL